MLVSTESTMSTGKAAKLPGVTLKTLQRWEREGRLVPFAGSDSNRRLYTQSWLREFQGFRQSGGVTPARLEPVALLSPTPF